MKRVILDTNIYGNIVAKGEEEELAALLEKRQDVIVYGFDAVRKELRDLSKDVRHGKKSVRIILLGVYDRLVKLHIYQTTSPIRQLAYDYYQVYSGLGGKRSVADMLNDFSIIACASIHELDVVVSEDNKTMFSKDAVMAYQIVNNFRRCRTPDFIGYEKFRRLLSL